MRMTSGVAALVLLTVSIAAARGAEQKDLGVLLKFVPQESVATTPVALPPSLLDKALAIEVDDGRNEADPRTIGTGTDDDDRTFRITSVLGVQDFVRASVTEVVRGFGVKSGATSDRTLRLTVTRFFVNESNKAVGSTYAAAVHFAYTVQDAGGAVLREGAAAGSASRYGRARSAANCSEVLSDALKDALAKVFRDEAMLDAWRSTGASTTAPAPPASKESVEQRLLQLNDLLKKGLITEEEYKVKRAEILKSA